MNRARYVEAVIDGGQWWVKFRSDFDGEVLWEGWVLDQDDPVHKAVAAAYKLMEDNNDER